MKKRMHRFAIRIMNHTPTPEGYGGCARKLKLTDLISKTNA